MINLAKEVISNEMTGIFITISSDCEAEDKHALTYTFDSFPL